MEDLIGLIVIIVFAVINLLSQAGKKKRPAPPGAAPDPDRGQPRQAPASIEEFFEILNEKLAPKPTPLPDWPEGRPRPDYAREASEYEQSRWMDFGDAENESEKIAAVAPPEQPKPPLLQPAEPQPVADLPRSSRKTFAGSHGLRMPSSPLLRSKSAGTLSFNLSKRANLKKAIIANIVFSPPRAYDPRFETTTMK